MIGAPATGGTQATATANVVSGKVSTITITNPGSRYNLAPAVSFTGGGGTGAVASARPTYAVAAVTMTNVGADYFNPGTSPPDNIYVTDPVFGSFTIPRDLYKVVGRV